MNPLLLIAVLVALSVIGFTMGRSRSLQTSGGSIRALHSVPSYYGFYVAAWVGLPALVLLFFWVSAEGWLIDRMVLGGLPDARTDVSPAEVSLLLADIKNYATGNIVRQEAPEEIRQAAAAYNRLHGLSDIVLSVAALGVAVAAMIFARRRIHPDLRARNVVERVVNILLILCATLAIVTTFGIVLSLLFESARFFGMVPVFDFLFGLQWSPQRTFSVVDDDTGSVASDVFGAVPVFAGTLMITIIAMTVAVPVGLLSAIYMSEYADQRVRSVAKPILEILAGIPTVVYGFFAALTMAPFVRDVGQSVGLDASAESALAAGFVMGIMIIPFVSSLSDDVINAVPQSLRDGSFALGATKAETIRQVLLPAALPGIVGSILLAVSRAIGETMIVVMAAGLAANLTANPIESVTTVTVQIVTMLTGDQEFDSPKTLSAFALGLVLFVVTLMLNVIALRVVQKYREKYD